jgi:hypothetical protein
MADKTIKHLQFWYTKQMKRGGKTVTAEQIAYQGDTVDITDPEDLARGEEHGAFYTDAELAAFAGEAPEQDASGGGVDKPEDFAAASVDDIADWMEDSGATIPDLLEIANDNPEAANKILEAENKIQSGDPRKGLVEGLTTILDRASA